MIKVRVSEAGGVFTEVVVPENSTVLNALQQAGARTDIDKQIVVNGEAREKDDIVSEGDTIYVVPNIKGNK